jgi:hypothetical protein
MGGETIWYQDPRAFLSDDRLVRFVPLPGTPLAAQLNAVMRFALYYGAFLFLFNRSYGALYVPIIAGVVTYWVHATDSDRLSKAREAMDALELEPDPVTNKLCTRPTLHNPFMNVLVSDYARFPERPGACDVSARPVARRAEKYFSHNLYRDSDDVFDRRANSRQFYTTPSSTIPNDQSGFARWLYSTGPTCKERSNACAARVHKHRPSF